VRSPARKAGATGKNAFSTSEARVECGGAPQGLPAGVSEEELGFLTVRSKDGPVGATEHWRKCCFDWPKRFVNCPVTMRGCFGD